MNHFNFTAFCPSQKMTNVKEMCRYLLVVAPNQLSYIIALGERLKDSCCYSLATKGDLRQCRKCTMTVSQYDGNPCQLPNQYESPGKMVTKM